MKGVERTIAEAREAVKAEPKRWGAAVYEGSETPLTDSPTTKVRLFVTIKTAEEELRERVNGLLGEGYRRTKWGVSHGIVKLEKGDDVVWVGLDKRRR